MGAEVVSVAQVDPVEEIERLFEVAGTERAVLDRLDGCVADLHAAHQAKSALQRFSAAQLREALTRRSRRLSGRP